jgi:hypothetical protein
MWAWWSLQNPGSEFRRNNRWCFIFQKKKRIEKLVQMKQTPAIAPPKLTPGFCLLHQRFVWPEIQILLPID